MPGSNTDVTPQAPAAPAPPPHGSTHRWRPVAALAISAAVLVAVVVMGLRLRAEPPADASGPLVVGTIDQPGAGSAWCTKLMAALPHDLAGLEQRTLADGGAGVLAWGTNPVVLRCGLPTPAELTCSSPLVSIDSVAWLELSDQDATTYLAVDRPVRIAVTVPVGTGTGPIQQISDIIGSALTARDICNDGVVVPTDA